MCVKKLCSLLVVLSVMVMLPMGAKALAIDTKGACQKSCRDDNGRCVQTCAIKIVNNTTSVDSMSFTLNYGEGVTLSEVTPGTGWTNASTSLTSKNLLFTASPAVTTKDFTIATLKFDVTDANVDCSIKIGFNNATYTVEDKTTTEVKTGATLPVAIISVGALAAGAIYLTTRKTKKMYKI